MTVNQLPFGVLDYSFINAKRGQQQGMMKVISFLKGFWGFLVNNFRLILNRIYMCNGILYILQFKEKNIGHGIHLSFLGRSKKHSPTPGN